VRASTQSQAVVDLPQPSVMEPQSIHSQAVVDLPPPFHDLHLLPAHPVALLPAHLPHLLPATSPSSEFAVDHPSSSLFCLPFQHPQVLLDLAVLYPPPRGYPQRRRGLLLLQRRQHHAPLPRLPALDRCSDRFGSGLAWCCQSDTSSGAACSPTGGVGLPRRGSRYSPSASLRRPEEGYGSTPRQHTPSARSLPRFVGLKERCCVSPQTLTSTSIRTLPLMPTTGPDSQ